MEATATAINDVTQTVVQPYESSGTPSPVPLSNLEKGIIWLTIKLRIFYFACIILKHPKKIWSVYKSMLRLRSNVWGGDLKKIYRIGGKYFFNQYTPGWPSAAYDALIKGELRRQASPLHVPEKLSFVFLAITRKCPMRCEHCFEWDNLNQKESFTKSDLLKVIDLYQKEGVLQFHFSGGEPMVRFKDLVELISYASNKSECWVLSSGFNVNDRTASSLKKAGCKGMVISIDHYIPELHNLFRGHSSSFEQATSAVLAARKAGLVVSISVCATKTFLDGGHLLPYIEFAKSLGVQFVQVLEPRSVGNYEGKNVMLEKKHIQLLEEVFEQVNHAPAYKHYPTLLYHGYHQRRVGCFSGSRSVYVDSAGDVHACPFCHTKSYNIIELVRGGETKLPVKQNSCPQFDKVA
ncbi:MAG TPA: radical SAM protein [Chitinophagaceae bacterium]|nr:radical SAM protein [Chitinophagaceae bacterium]